MPRVLQSRVREPPTQQPRALLPPLPRPRRRQPPVRQPRVPPPRAPLPPRAPRPPTPPLLPPPPRPQRPALRQVPPPKSRVPPHLARRCSPGSTWQGIRREARETRMPARKRIQVRIRARVPLRRRPEPQRALAAGPRGSSRTWTRGNRAPATGGGATGGPGGPGPLRRIARRPARAYPAESAVRPPQVPPAGALAHARPPALERGLL